MSIFIIRFYYKITQQKEVLFINRVYLKELIYKRYSQYSKTEAIEIFAKDLGVSRNVVYNILRHQLPREEILLKIGNILNVDYNILFQRKGK